MYKIITLNLGATSTKMLLYNDETLQTEIVLRHSDEDISANPLQGQQLELRYNLIRAAMEENDISFDNIDAVVTRITNGPSLKKSGTYLIGDSIREHLYKQYDSEQNYHHASVITMPLVDRLVKGYEVPIFIVDPTTIDEFSDVARVTGLPELERQPHFHALNQKTTARRAAGELGKRYDEVKLIVAHLGGGVSIGAHYFGKVIDSSDGGGGQDGPMTPNRCGRVPLAPLVKMCYSGKYDIEEIVSMLFTNGGFAAHTGHTDVRIIEEDAKNGDEKADLLLDAFVYQTCKEICEMYSVLGCECDGIVLTGGISYSDRIVNGIKAKIEKIGRVFVYPGEDEGAAMSAGALRVLRGEEEPIVV